MQHVWHWVEYKCVFISPENGKKHKYIPREINYWWHCIMINHNWFPTISRQHYYGQLIHIVVYGVNVCIMPSVSTLKMPVMLKLYLSGIWPTLVWLFRINKFGVKMLKKSYSRAFSHFNSYKPEVAFYLICC